MRGRRERADTRPRARGSSAARRPCALRDAHQAWRRLPREHPGERARAARPGGRARADARGALRRLGRLRPGVVGAGVSPRPGARGRRERLRVVADARAGCGAGRDQLDGRGLPDPGNDRRRPHGRARGADRVPVARRHPARGAGVGSRVAQAERADRFGALAPRTAPALRRTPARTSCDRRSTASWSQRATIAFSITTTAFVSPRPCGPGARPCVRASVRVGPWTLALNLPRSSRR